MATIKKYNGSTWENTTARKYETKSEIITPPTTIYTDGTAITAYTIKGNTVQNGTPTPTNPVDVVGVGTLDSGQYKIPISNGQQTTNIYLGSTQTVRQVRKLVLDGTENWVHAGVEAGQTPNFRIEYFTSAQPSKVVCTHYVSPNESISIFNQVEGVKVQTSAQVRMVLIIRPPEFAVWSVDDFKSFLAAQYAASTPVTVWYVLATPETATVNEPLMKIDTYADTLSNAASIPTTEGANSITVDTTVQPSEFTATWTGWHNANVKEWDGSEWQ